MTRLKGCLIAVVISFIGVALPAFAEQGVQVAAEVAYSETVGDTVNINTASAEQLSIVLKGVGLKRAQAIVDYREANGPFSDAAQLQEVKGIGDAIFEKNRDKIRL